MISILRAPLDANDAKLLHDLFAKRYELFVEGRGWRALARPDHLDIDQYDDDQTTYVIKQIGGTIVGGARLRPTVLRHMLRDVFGDLCDGGCPPVRLHGLRVLSHVCRTAASRTSRDIH